MGCLCRGWRKYSLSILEIYQLIILFTIVKSQLCYYGIALISCFFSLFHGLWDVGHLCTIKENGGSPSLRSPVNKQTRLIMTSDRQTLSSLCWELFWMQKYKYRWPNNALTNRLEGRPEGKIIVMTHALTIDGVLVWLSIIFWVGQQCPDIWDLTLHIFIALALWGALVCLYYKSRDLYLTKSLFALPVTQCGCILLYDAFSSCTLIAQLKADSLRHLFRIDAEHRYYQNRETSQLI